MILASLLVALNLPLLLKHPTLNYDDFALLQPLKTVTSFSDYELLRDRGLVFDLQPVRDVSYWLELQLEEPLSVRNSQLVNLILWITCLALFQFIVWHERYDAVQSVFCLFWVGLHPIVTESVDWISGRKHILSAMFLLSTVALVLVSRRRRSSFTLVLAFIAYGLALLSQPLSLGLMVWLAVLVVSSPAGETHVVRSNRFRLFSLATLVLSAWVAILNIDYYKSDAYQGAGGALSPKFHAIESSQWGSELSTRLMLLGRDAFQILAPFRPAVMPYDLTTPLSQSMALIGAAALIGAGVVLRRKRNQVSCDRLWLWLAAAPLAIVIVNLTGQGASDTYLLIPILSLGLFAASVRLKFRVWQKRILFILLGAFCLVDFGMAKVWCSDSSVWKYAFLSQGSLRSRLAYAKDLLNQAPLDRAQVGSVLSPVLTPTASQIAKREVDYGYVVGKFIFLSDQPDAKQTLFEENAVDDFWYQYYWSAFDAQRARFKQADQRLRTAWDRDPKRAAALIHFSKDEIFARWMLMCARAGSEDCADVKRRELSLSARPM